MSLNQSLRSWSDGPVKSSILDFVGRVTQSDGPEFTPLAERIAVFDNDGTLWCEQPLPVQAFFLVERVKVLAAQHPEMKQRQPFKALLEHDIKTLQALGKQALFELFFATHAGMTTEEFDPLVREWFDTARHPTLDRLFKECTYVPQLELLDYLRANGFKTYMVSGGGIDFIRSLASDAYGIVREQVIGSSQKLRFDVRGSETVLTKLAELNSFNDHEAKPQNIGLHIGRRPILAFGNSDGDLAMLRYTKAGKGARLALLVHHDDAAREFAYDRDFRVSPLAEALDKASDYGITVVSMTRDWGRVF